MNPVFYFLLALPAVLAANPICIGPATDIHGNLVHEGVAYNLLPFESAFGGLSLAPFGGNQCPLYITQVNSQDDFGSPVIISNWDIDDDCIYESENLTIEMQTTDTICGAESTYWWVAPLDKDSKQRFVVAGPKPGPGEDSSNGLFQILGHGECTRVYQILFCPNGKDCIDVGIFVDEHGVRRLALTSTPFLFGFEEAYYQETSPKTKSMIIKGF